MKNGSKLVSLMKKAGKMPTSALMDFVEGKVTSVTPLTISMGKIELDDEFLLLSPMCKNLTLNLSHDHGLEVQELSSVQIFRDLEVGDSVLMLRGSVGQLYYVLQRQES